MKYLQLSDNSYAALERLAAAKNLSPEAVIDLMLGEGRPPLAGDHLLFHLLSREFAAIEGPTDRYLALLAWVARGYACDFADFISHQESALRYLGLSREEIEEVRAQNHARQVPGTQYWAVMNLDDQTKSRFIRRLLEFVGCHDETVRVALRELGLPESHTAFRLLGVA